MCGHPCCVSECKAKGSGFELPLRLSDQAQSEIVVALATSPSVAFSKENPTASLEKPTLTRITGIGVAVFMTVAHFWILSDLSRFRRKSRAEVPKLHRHLQQEAATSRMGLSLLPYDPN